MPFKRAALTMWSSTMLGLFFFLSALFTTGVAEAGIVHVSNDVALSTGSTSSLKLAVKAVAANDLMVVGLSYCCKTSAPVVSDNMGNIWYLLKQESDTTGDTIAMYYAIASVGGVTLVTVSPNSEQYIGASFSEYSGVNPSQPLDSSAVGQVLKNTKTADSGSVTPSQVGDLLVTIAYNDNNAKHSPGSGFTALAEVSSPQAIAAEYQVDSSASSIDGKIVFTTSYTLPAIMQAFSPSSGSVSPTTTTSTTSTSTTSTTVKNTTTTTTSTSTTSTTVPNSPPTTTTSTTTTSTTIKMTTTTTTLPSSGGNPATGAHTLAYFICGSSGVLETSPINTAVSGSSILTWVGRGNIGDFTSANAPKSNFSSNGAPIQIGSTQNYSPYYPDSGDAVYAWPQYSGGLSSTFSFNVPPADEITAMVVEVLNGGSIADYSYVQIAQGSAEKSGTVTTTGPATLVAIWTGDSAANSAYATPDSGFTVIESQTNANCHVEATMATKDVSSAGTYSVTWTPNVSQHAYLWLIAIQKK